MKAEAQRLAIARACGWQYAGTSGHENADVCLWFRPNEDHIYHRLPDYLNDLNAMQSAVLTQSTKFQDQFDSTLKNSGKWIASMTAKEWAEIFLRALDKWKEEP